MAAPSLEETIFSQRFIRRTILAAILLQAVLVAGDLIFCILLPQSPRLLRFEFDVDQRGNWASWYSSTLDMAAGVAAVLVAWLAKRVGMKEARSFSRRWLAIGGIFVYLGMDRAAQIHEHIYGSINFLADLLAQWLPGISQIGWTGWLAILGIPGVILLLYVAKAVYRDIWPHRLARWLFIAALALGVSFPIIGSMQARLTPPLTPGSAPQSAEQLAHADRQAWLQVPVINLVQEVTETTAVVCLLVAFLLIGKDMVTIPKGNIRRAAIPLISREVFRASQIGKYA